MQLNKEMAEKISIRSMRIIQHSVNVMDEFGFIIASGDPSRINCRHEGASLAINENRIIEINHAMTQQLRGVKIGINFPILFQNKIIGVVGISGEPSHVRKYGELVKMTAELIIEQAALITDIQWNKRHLEELVLQLVTSSDLSEVQLHSITQRLKIDPLQERIAIVVKVNPDNGQCLSLEHLQKVVQLLNAQERDLMVAIVSISRNEILVLKPTQFKNKKWCYSAEHNWAKKLQSHVAQQEIFSIRIAIGSYFPHLKGLHQSFKSAQDTLIAAPNKKNILFYKDNVLAVLLSQLKKEKRHYQQLQAPLNKLIKQDPNGILQKTLILFFKQNCDIAQTCKSLYIHRNTLRYRLDKIESKTGLNINRINDKVHLYLALMSHH